MEKQYKLVGELLRRMSDTGILSHILLIGSWCATYYQSYFKGSEYHVSLKTRDIDFLVPRHMRMTRAVDLEKLLEDLGFECEFYGKGYIKLENEELSIEFLVPEIGPGQGKPYPLPHLKLNAQPLRHLAMLWRDPVQTVIQGITVNLPHPADFCLHKLIILKRRKEALKKSKDYETALFIFDSLLTKEGRINLDRSFAHLTRREKEIVLGTLQKSGRDKIFSE